MGRLKTAPDGFVCPYRDNCPHLEGLSAFWMFEERQRSKFREHEHWQIREQMTEEIASLCGVVSEQKQEIERLKAENKLLHQRGFKPSKSKPIQRGEATSEQCAAQPPKPRGAPKGHPPWVRKVPERIDRHIHVEAPLICTHCQSATEVSIGGQTSYIQEDIVLVPQTVVTSYVHDTAFCPGCKRQVIHPLEGELPFAPIGPNAKATALYLRHALKVPYRKITEAMETLFGIDFVPASTLGFEKRAGVNARPIHQDLIDKIRSDDLIHADETHWRQDGQNCWLWYAGNESLSVFRIDPHRSSEAAKNLLGDKLDGLLVTDAYAAYNVIDCAGGRQSCLAHLLRKSKEIGEELALIDNADAPSLRFCQSLSSFFKEACALEVPKQKRARKKLANEFRKKLAPICRKPLAFGKAETLRKRLIPTSREYPQLFAFIEHGGPPTNNHAERSLRPLVIFRKVCLGTRSATGSENISVFGSLTQTAALQGAKLIDMFRALFRSTPNAAQDVIFSGNPEPNPSG
jgi:transposase